MNKFSTALAIFAFFGGIQATNGAVIAARPTNGGVTSDVLPLPLPLPDNTRWSQFRDFDFDTSPPTVVNGWKQIWVRTGDLHFPETIWTDLPFTVAFDCKGKRQMYYDPSNAFWTLPEPVKDGAFATFSGIACN